MNNLWGKLRSSRRRRHRVNSSSTEHTDDLGGTANSRLSESLPHDVSHYRRLLENNNTRAAATDSPSTNTNIPASGETDPPKKKETRKKRIIRLKTSKNDHNWKTLTEERQALNQSILLSKSLPGSRHSGGRSRYPSQQQKRKNHALAELNSKTKKTGDDEGGDNNETAMNIPEVIVDESSDEDHHPMFDEIIQQLYDSSSATTVRNRPQPPKDHQDIDWDKVYLLWNHVKYNLPPGEVKSVCKCRDKINGDNLLIWLIMVHANLDLILSVLSVFPEAAHTKFGLKMTALHNAICWNSPIEVVKILLEEYPRAAQEKDVAHKTPLHHAMGKQTSLKILQMILTVFPFATREKDETGSTPLHCGMSNPQISMDAIQLVLEVYPDVGEEKDILGKTALHRGLDNKTIPFDVVELLLKTYPGAAKEKCDRGDTPLHGAVKINVPLEVVQLVLDAYPYAAKEKNTDGNTPLNQGIAKKNISPSVIQAILQACPDAAKVKDNNDMTPLHFGLVHKASFNVIRVVLMAYPDAAKAKDKYGRTALHSALSSWEFSPEVVHAVLNVYPEAAQEKDFHGQTPLHRAMANKVSPEIIHSLLKAHSNAAKDKANDGRYPLHFGVAYGASTDAIQVVLDAYPDAAKEKDKNDGKTPLHCAMERNASLNIVQLLVKAYPNAVRELGKTVLTPLHCGIAHKASLDIIQVVLDAYPDAAKEKGKYGMIPLHSGLARRAPSAVIRVVIDAYPDAVKEKLLNGQTALHYALEKRASSDVIQVLVDAYPEAAKVKTDDAYDAMTPLHYGIIYKSSSDIFRVILEAYPDAAKARDKHGQTPLHYGMAKKASIKVITIILDAYKEAAREKDYNGKSPLQLGIENEASPHVIQSVLCAYPEAAQEKDNYGHTPLHHGKANKVSKEMMQILINSSLSAEKEMLVIETFYESLDLITTVNYDGRICRPKNHADFGQVKQLLKYTKDQEPELVEQVLTMTDMDYRRNLLGWCLLCEAPPEVIMSICEACPASVTNKDKNGNTPIYCGVKHQGILFDILRGEGKLREINYDTVITLRSLREGLRDGRLFHQLCHRDDKFSLQVFFWTLSNQPSPIPNAVPVVDFNIEVLPGWNLLEILVDTDNEEASEIFFQIREHFSKAAPEKILKIYRKNSWGISNVASFESVAKIEDVTWRRVADRARLSHVKRLRDWGETYGRFLGKYRIDPETDPKHISDTCVVVFGTELRTVESRTSSEDLKSEVNVAFKFMVDKEAFQREISNRAKIDQNYVVGIKAAYTSQTMEDFNLKKITNIPIRYNEEFQVALKEYSNIKLRNCTNQLLHILVMDCGSGVDLSDILSHQNIVGKDLNMIYFVAKKIVECLEYLNMNNLMHGDVKGRNFVSLGVAAGYIAIDLDNSAQINEEKAGQKRTSSGYLPPEQAAVEYHLRLSNSNRASPEALKETELEIKNLKKLRMKAMAESDDEDDEESEKLIRSLTDKIEEAKDKKARLEKSSPPSEVIASAQYDMWCFGVLLYHLCTGKTLFDMDGREEVNTRELKNIKDWSEHDLNAKLYEHFPRGNGWKKLGSLLKVLLKPRKDDRPSSWNVVMGLLQSAQYESQSNLQELQHEMKEMNRGLQEIAREQTQCLVEITDIVTENKMSLIEASRYLSELSDAVDEIPKVMVEIFNINCPYVFDFLSEESFKRWKDNEIERYESYPDKILSIGEEFEETLTRAKHIYECCTDFMHSTSKRTAVKSAVASGWQFLHRGKREVVYMQLLCGWTLKPVVTYKIEQWRYPNKVQELAKIGANICSVALSVALVWNAAGSVPRMFGYPIPNIPSKKVEAAKDFLKKINESSPPVDDFRSGKESGLNMEELQEFHAFLYDLESNGRMRQCFDEFEKTELRRKSWKDAFVKEVVKLENKEKHITFVSIRDSKRLGGKLYQIADNSIATA